MRGVTQAEALLGPQAEIPVKKIDIITSTLALVKVVVIKAGLVAKLAIMLVVRVVKIYRETL